MFASFLIVSLIRNHSKTAHITLNVHTHTRARYLVENKTYRAHEL